MRSSIQMARLRWFAAPAAVFCAGVAAAAEIAVSAQLSRSAAGVGEPVQLQVKVAGSRAVGQPPTVEVDGLRISYLGPSQNTNVRFENGNVVSETSVTYIYQVEATRAGNFVIPSLAIPVDGRTLQTRPIALRAEEAGSRSEGADPGQGSLEIVLPKRTAYVGEMLPLEIRMAVDSRVHWQPEGMPTIPGDGFTKQKIPEPRQERGSQDGRDLDLLIFRTAITPGRAGKITLGPVEIPYVAQVPRAQRNRPRSFFDDVFGDPFFSVNQRYKARSEAVDLEVKPLPAAGRPANFSGALGQFKLTATGAPSRVKIGDPVTMKLTVRGRGNFDRIEAPALLDPTGWRSYPATAEFKSDDDLGMTGAKTFSVAVIPEAKQQTMPGFEFVYFDPEAEKYVTLTSEPEALVVEGAVPSPVATSAPIVARTDEPPPPPQDILGLRYDAGGGRRSFEPLHERRWFLIAQVVPLAGWCAMLFLKLRRNDPGARRIAALKRERAEVLAKLRGRELPDQEFLEAAARVIQMDVALVSGGEPGSVDGGFARAARQLDEETAAGVERIFGARAELLYAGVKAEGERLSVDERRQVMKTLECFERSPARA